MTEWNKLTLKSHSHAPTTRRCRLHALSLSRFPHFFLSISMHCTLFIHTDISKCLIRCMVMVSMRFDIFVAHQSKWVCVCVCTGEWVSICNQVTGVGVMLCVFVLCFMCDLMCCFASYVMLYVSLHLDIASCLREDALFWMRFLLLLHRTRVEKSTRTSCTGHTLAHMHVHFFIHRNNEVWNSEFCSSKMDKVSFWTRMTHTQMQCTFSWTHFIVQCCWSFWLANGVHTF